MVNVTVLVGAVVFMLINVLVGFLAGRNVNTSKSFFLAGGDQKLFPIMATQAATAIGGGCMIGWVGFGFSFGWGVMWYGICCGIGLLAVLLLVGKFFQKQGFCTIPDWLCHNLGEDKWLRGISGLLSMWLLITAWAGNVVATGTIINQLSGLSLQAGAIIGGVLVLGYCILGGMQSVIKTDILNFIFLWVGIIILIPATVKAAGGISAVTQATPPENMDIWPGTAVGIAWMVALIPGMMTMQTVYQRFSASKSLKVARWGIFGTVIAVIVISIYASITGMALRIINPDIKPQLAVPWFSSNQLHPIFGMFILGGILAALFSTSNSVINSSASNIARDFYQGIVKPDASDKDVLKAGRIATLAVGVFGILIALYIPSIMKLILAGYAISAGGLLFPIFLAHFWKKTTRAGVLTGMIFGFLIVFISTFIPAFAGFIKAYLYNGTVAALVISLVLTVVVSLATRKKEVRVS